MRVCCGTTLLMALLLSAGCSGADGVTPLDQLPRALPLTSGPVDPKLVARMEFPLPSPQDGRYHIRVTVTNTRADTVTGGVCAERVDGRPFGLEAWYDASPRDVGCTRQAMVLPPGGSGVITATADRARLRDLTMGPGGVVWLRARMTLTSSTGVQMVMQSDEIGVSVW